MMRNHPHRDSLPYFRLTALVAALALALPAPLDAAPADHLRAGQARRTAVGLKELPQTLGHAPETAPSAGLEEGAGAERPAAGVRTVLGLSDLAQRVLRVGEGGAFYPLTEGQSVSISFPELARIPEGVLDVYLGGAGDRAQLFVHPDGAVGVVAVTPHDSSPGRPPITVNLGESLTIGSRFAVSSDASRVWWPGGSGALSPDHLMIQIARSDGSRPPQLILRSAGASYFLAAQVQAMVSIPPAAGLEEGASPEDALDQFLNELVLLPQPSRILLEGFPDDAQERIPAGGPDTVSDLKLAMGDLPEGSRLVWENVMPQATEWRLHLTFLPLVREQLFRRLGDVLVRLSKHLAEGLAWNQAAYEAMQDEVSRHWASRGGRPEWRHDLVADQIRHLMASPGVAAWVQGDALVRAPAWLAAAVAVAAQTDSGRSALDGAVPIAVAEVQAQLARDAAAAAQEPPTPLGAEGETFLNTVLSFAQSATGLEEGTGEGVRIAISGSDEQMRYILQDLAIAWGSAHEKRHPGAEVQVRSRFQHLQQFPELPYDDVALVGISMDATDPKTAVERTTPWLNAIAPLVGRTETQLGVVVVAPTAVHRAVARRLTDCRIAHVLLLDRQPRILANSSPGKWFPLERGAYTAGIREFVNGLADAALDRRRGGLPEGRIFNAKTSEFRALVKALELTRPPAKDAMALRQFEDAVRHRVLAMSAAALARLATDVSRRGPAGAVLDELSQLRTRAKLVAFLKEARQHEGNFWREMANPSSPHLFGVEFESPSTPYRMNVVASFEGAGHQVWLEVAMYRKNPHDDLTQWEQQLFQQYALQLTYRPPSPGALLTTPSIHCRTDQIGAEARFDLTKAFGTKGLNLRPLARGGQLRLHITGPGLPDIATAGLEEGAGEELRIAQLSPSTVPVFKALPLAVGEWMRQGLQRFPSLHVEVGVETPTALWKAGAKHDLILLGTYCRPEDSPEAVRANLQAVLDRIADYASGIGAEVGVVIAVPEEEARRDAVMTQVRAITLPSVRLQLLALSDNDRAPDQIHRFLDRLAAAAIAHRRGGLPEGRIFDARMREFSVLTAALVRQAVPNSEVWVKALLGRKEPLALDEGGGYYALLALAALGEPVPDTDLSSLEMPLSNPQPQFVWQLEEAVRRRVLAMDAAALTQLAMEVSRLGTTGAVLDELQQLRTRTELVRFLQTRGLWKSAQRTPGGIVTGFQDGPYKLVFMMTEIHGALSVVVVVERTDGQALGEAGSLLQRYTVQVVDTKSHDASLAKRLEGGDRARASLTTLLSEFYGAPVQLMNPMFAQFDVSNFQCVKNATSDNSPATNRFQLRITGPGLEPAAGLEEATVEQAARTEADPTLGQYY